jgi:hypothetical protein
MFKAALSVGVFMLAFIVPMIVLFVWIFLKPYMGKVGAEKVTKKT